MNCKDYNSNTGCMRGFTSPRQCGRGNAQCYDPKDKALRDAASDLLIALEGILMEWETNKGLCQMKIDLAKMAIKQAKGE